MSRTELHMHEAIWGHIKALGSIILPGTPQIWWQKTQLMWASHSLPSCQKEPSLGQQPVRPCHLSPRPQWSSSAADGPRVRAAAGNTIVAPSSAGCIQLHGEGGGVEGKTAGLPSSLGVEKWFLLDNINPWLLSRSRWRGAQRDALGAGRARPLIQRSEAGQGARRTAAQRAAPRLPS